MHLSVPHLLLQVLGSNYKSELLAVVAPENLPVQFGGLSPCEEMADVGPWHDPAIIAQCPALRKAAAAGHLQAGKGLVASDSSNSLRRGSSSLIAAGSDHTQDSNSGSSCGEEACSAADSMCAAEGVVCA